MVHGFDCAGDHKDNAQCGGCEKICAEKYQWSMDGKRHIWSRSDHFGIYTGIYCTECYNSNDSTRYPYKKDRYETIEYDGYGERLEPLE